jgi:hypothetical protein
MKYGAQVVASETVPVMDRKTARQYVKSCRPKCNTRLFDADLSLLETEWRQQAVAATSPGPMSPCDHYATPEKNRHGPDLAHGPPVILHDLSTDIATSLETFLRYPGIDSLEEDLPTWPRTLLERLLNDCASGGAGVDIGLLCKEYEAAFGNSISNDTFDDHKTTFLQVISQRGSWDRALTRVWERNVNAVYAAVQSRLTDHSSYTPVSAVLRRKNSLGSVPGSTGASVGVSPCKVEDSSVQLQDIVTQSRVDVYLSPPPGRFRKQMKQPIVTLELATGN